MQRDVGVILLEEPIDYLDYITPRKKGFDLGCIVSCSMVCVPDTGIAPLFYRPTIDGREAAQ